MTAGPHAGLRFTRLTFFPPLCGSPLPCATLGRCEFCGGFYVYPGTVPEGL